MPFDWSKYAPQAWRSEVAPCALPILILCAKEGRTITYTQLALELKARFGLEPKARKTLYGQPVGAIGFALEDLGKSWGHDIPPLNALVVSQGSGLPGKGADSFVTRFLRKGKRIRKEDRPALMQEAWQQVWHYPDWDRVAKSLDAQALDRGRESSLRDDEPIKLPKPGREGGQPESPQHKALKAWACANPKFFSAYGTFGHGTPERPIQSGDRLDAFFSSENDCLAVEVKASNAPNEELIRGVFQCIKYRAVLRATQLAQGNVPNAQAVLVTTGVPNDQTKRLLKRLQVQLLRAPLHAER